MLEKAAETVETENRPAQAACYVAKLLKNSLEKRDEEESIRKARKLVELYQVSLIFQITNKKHNIIIPKSVAMT